MNCRAPVKNNLDVLGTRQENMEEDDMDWMMDDWYLGPTMYGTTLPLKHKYVFLNEKIPYKESS